MPSLPVGGLSTATRADEVRVINFLLSLPIPLPLPERWSFSWQSGEPIEVLVDVPMVPTPSWQQRLPSPAGCMWSFFRFHKRNIPALRNEGDEDAIRQMLQAAGRDVGEDTERTPRRAATWVISIQTPLNALPSGDPFGDSLDRCLDGLTRLVDALRIAGHGSTPSVRRETLAPMAVYRTRSARAYDWSPPLWFAVNRRVPDPTDLPDLSDMERGEWRRFMTRREMALPDAICRLHLADARASLEERGEPGVATIEAATAAEVLLDGTMRFLLWEEAASKGVIRRVFGRKVTLSQRITKHFPRRLGGIWNQDAPGVLGEWRAKVADPRNRAVHSGEEPTHDQALLAIATVESLMAFVESRLIANIAKYPRTALMFLTPIELRARGALTAEVVGLVAAESSETSDLAGDFRAWRARVSL